MRKEQKGITLIALILTIVVLLIIALVAILSIQDYQITGQANNAATKYEEERGKEGDVLQSYEDLENKYATNSVTDTKVDDTKVEDTVVDNTNTGTDSDINDDDEWTKNY